MGQRKIGPRGGAKFSIDKNYRLPAADVLTDCRERGPPVTTGCGASLAGVDRKKLQIVSVASMSRFVLPIMLVGMACTAPGQVWPPPSTRSSLTGAPPHPR